MENFQILDCTLRDGGYCNQWNFGYDNIKKIINGLVESNIDIIECGFLTNKVEYNREISKYSTIQEIAEVLPNPKQDKMYVCMINYGEYSLENIPDYTGDSVDGIRVAFHKKNVEEALKFCMGIKEKGYKVFVQPMMSLSYTDEEFISLIQKCNDFEPYAFYIVDSLGAMKRKDLVRLFYMVEHNLKNEICIGYHSHNNMQLAYSNAQALIDIRTNRNMILDSSIFGMGRGAGNLNTELIVEYMNDNIGTEYKLRPLLIIIDEILNHFYLENYWGYSLPNYLSAKHNVHPNYASYLDEKKTLTIENMNEIFSSMEDDKRISYSKEYIEELYNEYMANVHVKESKITELQELLAGKEVLIIAPGKSAVEEKDKVVSLAQKENVVSISINFDYAEYETDYIFISNIRRFRELNDNKHKRCIVTSNISTEDVYMQTDYSELINSTEAVKDNAGLMLIKLLMLLKVKKVYIAGIDGYSVDASQNFADERMSFVAKKDTFAAMNSGITKVLCKYREKIDIQYITTPKYIKI